MGMRMANIGAVVVTIVLLGCMSASEGWMVEPKVIHIGGKVLCQDCNNGWNEWAHGAKPIKGSRVSITCVDERSRVFYYDSDLTDEEGVFEITVNKLIKGKVLKPELCKVRVVSSPDQACNVPTDFGHGKTGVELSLPSFVYRELVKYMVGPFYYTSSKCVEPQTTYLPQEPKY